MVYFAECVSDDTGHYSNCFVVGIFLNGRKEKVAKAQLLTKPALDTIWHETDHQSDIEGQ